MKGRDIIKIIQDNQLEEFELKIIKEGLIEESKYGKDYYVRTKRNG